MVVLGSQLTAGLHAGGPGDDARVGRAALELVALPHLERRVEGHGPTVGVVVVGLGSAELVDHGQVGVDVVGDAVHEHHLVDRAVGAALAAGAVVGDQHDQGVVPLADELEEVEQPADLMVGVGEEPGVDLGHAGEQLLLLRRQRVPRAGDVDRREGLPVGTLPRLGGADRVDRRQHGVLRDDAHLLLAGQGLLAHLLVAHVELALELVDPLLGGVVRGVAGAG